MAVFCKNESNSNIRFTSTNKRGQEDKFVAPGQEITLSDEEWQSIALKFRGPGGMNPFDPAADSTGGEKTELDYYSPFSSDYELRYLGEAAQTAAITDPVWTIKRFSHLEVVSGDVRIAEIQILREQVWGVNTAARDALPWS